MCDDVEPACRRSRVCRIAGTIGLTPDQMGELAALGPGAADLLLKCLQTLGVTAVDAAGPAEREAVVQTSPTSRRFPFGGDVGVTVPRHRAATDQPAWFGS
jgi:hypothetical protein